MAKQRKIIRAVLYPIQPSLTARDLVRFSRLRLATPKVWLLRLMMNVAIASFFGTATYIQFGDYWSGFHISAFVEFAWTVMCLPRMIFS